MLTFEKVETVLNDMGVNWEAYDEEITIHHSAFSGEDYQIGIDFADGGAYMSTSRSSDDFVARNEKLVKTAKGVKGYVNKIIER